MQTGMNLHDSRIIIFVLMDYVAVPKETTLGRSSPTPPRSTRSCASTWTLGSRSSGRTTSGLVYVDGFAGPGSYTGGEPGSPIVALEVAESTTRPSLPSELVFLFHRKRKRQG